MLNLKQINQTDVVKDALNYSTRRNTEILLDGLWIKINYVYIDA